MTEPYTRDEIERILRRETCRPDDYETDRCHRHNGLMPLVGDSCTRRRSDLLAIIRQLLDQTDRARLAAPEGHPPAPPVGFPAPPRTGVGCTRRALVPSPTAHVAQRPARAGSGCR